MLYQPIWLYALCDLYWEQVHAAKNLYRAHIISLMVIWLRVCTYRDHIISAHLAVCIMWPVLGTGTCCKLISTHIISLMIIWLHVLYISDICYISPSGCVHYVACIGNRYTLQNLYRHISFVIIWLHVMYISQHIYLYPSVWLCALCNLYWGTGTCCKLIPKYMLYHFWLYDCM